MGSRGVSTSVAFHPAVLWLDFQLILDKKGYARIVCYLTNYALIHTLSSGYTLHANCLMRVRHTLLILTYHFGILPTM